jgi:hypothetical protein
LKHQRLRVPTGESRFVVLEGEAENLVGSEWLRLHCGSNAFIPPWIVYQSCNVSAEAELPIVTIADRRPVAQRASLEGVLQGFSRGLAEYTSARPKQPRHPKIPVLKLVGWKGFERLQPLRLARPPLPGCKQ